jgi:4-hydroxysphinganine ceramide fatty acyl 2-hydroxylase
MPSKTLPTFTRAEVEKNNTERSCYVTVGTKVYDITSFLFDHPGGHRLILDYAGKDIEDILKDSVSHQHTEIAYDILDDSLVGFLVPEKNGTANGNGAVNGDTYVHPRTGMSTEDDLSKDTDYNQDYKKHKFLDLGKPLFPQLWYGNFTKRFYLDQVHRPRHYKGGESAPLFGNFLEPLTKTPWWVIPILWLPCDAYGGYLALQGFANPITFAAYWIFGFCIWSLVEYGLHRFLFHLDEYDSFLTPPTA